MTQLSPLEEHLFQAWARAHGVDNHDDPNNQFDHRGLYKASNGKIMPGHMVRAMADAHNKAASEKSEGGNVEFPDPYMAQAEMHKANLDAHSKSASEQNKVALEHAKMKHKMLIEQMKMQHQSAEKEKDRQHKAQAEQAKVHMQAAQAEQQRQADMQMAHQQRQFQVEDAQTQRQQAVEDQVRGHHFDIAKTREAAMHKPMSPAGQPTRGPAQMGPGTPPPHQGNPLEQQLMQRAMGNGQPR